MATEDNSEQQLKRSLGPIMLWGLGVGYVISGMYFGWNLGLEKGGTDQCFAPTRLAISFSTRQMRSCPQQA